MKKEKIPKEKMLLHGSLVDKEHPTKAVITNHYGVTVNSEEPVTCVFQNNHVEYLFDDMYNTVDLDYEWALNEYLQEKVQAIKDLLEDFNYEEDRSRLYDLVAEIEDQEIDLDSTTEWLIGFKEVFFEF